jgi:DNA-binding LytR/AlgR family response regulator
MKTNKSNTVHVGGRQHLLPNEIILLQANENYTCIFLSDGQKIIVATTLKTLEKRFQSASFCRTHKSFLINLSCVKSHSATSILLNNEIEVTLSRRKKEMFQKAFDAIISY